MRKALWLLAVCAAGLVTIAAGAQQKSPATAPARKPAAVAKKAPAAKKPMAVPFSAGERLTYDISWSSYLTAGTATVTVQERRNTGQSQAYYIVAEGQPTPLLSKLYTLYYKADTLLDAYTLLPHRGSVYSQEGRRQRTKTTTFNQPGKSASYEVKTATTVNKAMKMPANTQDALSAVYVLRAIPLKQGDTFDMPVADSGTWFRVKMRVDGREMVRSGVGTVNAWKITPTIVDTKGKAASARQMSVWISDDARRLPVKMKAEVAVGSFDFTLREVRAGLGRP
ncbi:MAG: DUF3108 domain-containing protein [Vicinamibacteraceae bacterium]|nr:DUF3108 domain-containing protein [Vicinamibacteraceae bacterium]